MHVVVVGAGASGMLVTVQLLSRDEVVEVTLIDRDPVTGGTAYRQPDRSLLLNVRANAMGADPEAPHGFLDWVREQDPDTPADAFLPRRQYGEYLDALLAVYAGRRLHRVYGEVEAIEAGDDARETVVLRDGRRVTGDAVVLALGNPLPAPLPGTSDADERVVRDPLSPDALAAVDTHDPVTVVGGGLTGVDVVIALTIRGHVGPVTVLSPRGWLPLVHCEHGCTPVESEAFAELAARPSVRLVDAVATLRAEVRRAEADDRCWRSAIDSQRPYTNELWKRFSDADRRRYVRRLHPYFERHRHRVAPAVHHQVQAQLDSGRLRVARARMASLDPAPASGDGQRVVVTTHGERIPTSWVFNATGASLRATAYGPLVARLRTEGRARPGWSGLGLAVDDDGQLLDADGRRQPTLWTIGPICRGTRWETTALPEIRIQAARLARELLSTRSELERSS